MRSSAPPYSSFSARAYAPPSRSTTPRRSAAGWVVIAFEADQKNPQPTLGIFSTGPEIRNPTANLMTEIIATIGLVLPILAFGKNDGIGIGQIPGEGAGIYGSGISILLVSLLVVGIGLSLGGPTGYAGPVIGGLLSGLIFNAAF